jgi:hypothetical protein
MLRHFFGVNLQKECCTSSYGQEWVGFRVKATDTVSTLCTKLRNQINNDSNLQTIGAHATCNSNVVSVASFSPNQSLYQPLIQGTVINCTLVRPAPWTGARLYSCGTVSANAVSLAKSTLTALGNTSNPFIADSATKLRAGAFAWYIYADQAEYKGSLLGNGPLAPRTFPIGVNINDFGGTYFASGSPPYSVVFENAGVGASIPDIIIPHVVAHETGHLLDDVSYATTP